MRTCTTLVEVADTAILGQDDHHMAADKLHVIDEPPGACLQLAETAACGLFAVFVYTCILGLPSQL